MKVQINYDNVKSSEALEEHIAQALESTVGRFADRLSRVEVYLSDLNGPEKGGPDDKQCRIEARPNGFDPVTVDSRGDSYYEAVDDTAGKLRRLLTKRLERD